MSLKEKRQREMDHLKERRKGDVVYAAVLEMQEKGIDNAKIADIATRAEVGVASVYRYFKTKQELVVAAAIRFWSDELATVYPRLSKSVEQAPDGLSKTHLMLNAFIELYRNHRGFVRFIEEFDNYVIKEGIDKERLAEYEQHVWKLEELVLSSIEEGRQAGLIRKDLDANLFYVTVTHALMSLVQKLSLRGEVLASDNNTDDEAQIQLLIDMAIHYLSY